MVLGTQGVGLEELDRLHCWTWKGITHNTLAFIMLYQIRVTCIFILLMEWLGHSGLMLP